MKNFIKDIIGLICIIALTVIQYHIESAYQMAIAPLVAAALISAAPSIISGIGGLFGKKKKEKQLQKSLAPLKSLYSELSDQQKQGYMNSTEGAGMANRIGDNSEDQRQQLSNMSDLSNLTDEAKLAGLDSINKNEGNALSSLAMQGTRYRESKSRQRQGLLQQLTGFETGQRNMNRNLNTEAINANANMGQGLVQLLMSGGGGAGGATAENFNPASFGAKSKKGPGIMGGINSMGKVQKLTFGK